MKMLDSTSLADARKTRSQMLLIDAAPDISADKKFLLSATTPFYRLLSRSSLYFLS